MRIAHLYPDLLNLYGDRGNIMCLQYRCRQRGIQVTVDEISVGDPFDHTKYDLLFIGGGKLTRKVFQTDLSNHTLCLKKYGFLYCLRR